MSSSMAAHPCPGAMSHALPVVRLAVEPFLQCLSHHASIHAELFMLTDKQDLIPLQLSASTLPVVAR
jgi:hypothetical protein